MAQQDRKSAKQKRRQFTQESKQRAVQMHLDG